MISICTVILNRLEDFAKIFYQSIVESTSKVSEVVIVNVEMDESINNCWEKSGIKFRLVGGKHNAFKIYDPPSFCAQHAYGMHQAIELATNDYLLLSDPDIFFYTQIDDFYLSLMQEYDLKLIGISKPDALAQSIAYFPCIMNLLTKREYLPTKEFMPDFDLGLHSDDKNYQNKLPGKYLYHGTIERYKPLFPNPSGHLETGCNLLVWAKEQNYKWMSFQTPDCHVYYSKYYRSNFKIKNLPNKKILYHASLSAGPHNRIVPFTEAWENYKTGE